MLQCKHCGCEITMGYGVEDFIDRGTFLCDDCLTDGYDDEDYRHDYQGYQDDIDNE